MSLNRVPIPDDDHMEDGVAKGVLSVGVATLLDAGVVDGLVGVAGGPGQVILAKVGQTFIVGPLGGP